MLNIPADIPQFKVVLCGDGGTGKTTLVNKHKTGEFRRAYIRKACRLLQTYSAASVGATVIPLDWYTNYGRVVLKIWDTVSTHTPTTHATGWTREAFHASRCLLVCVGRRMC